MVGHSKVVAESSTRVDHPFASASHLRLVDRGVGWDHGSTDDVRASSREGWVEYHSIRGLSSYPSTRDWERVHVGRGLLTIRIQAKTIIASNTVVAGAVEDGDTHQTKFDIEPSTLACNIARRKMNSDVRVQGRDDICRRSASACLRTLWGHEAIPGVPFYLY